MSSSGLKDQIQDAMKTAMKGGDKERLAVSRSKSMNGLNSMITVFSVSSIKWSNSAASR
jgi:uncharacterized protein YqeY